MKQKQNGNQNQHAIKSMLGLSENEEELMIQKIHLKTAVLKKVLIAVVILLGTSAISNAQFQWGVKLGANASTQSEIGNLCKDNDLKGGVNVGLIGKYNFNDWIALKSGIESQMKGKKCDDRNTDDVVKDKLNYLILPVKAEFSASEKAGFKNGQRLFFATGSYLGYLLDANQKIGDLKTNLTDFENFDFGWSLELGMEFPVLRSNAIQVSLNYDMGISEIVKEANIQNKSASLNFGFVF